MEKVVSLFLAYLFSDVAAIIEFDCYSEHHMCLNDSVQYQCIVNDSNTLQWRIRDESMTSLGTESYTSTSDLVPFTPISNDAAQFSTNLSSTSPSIISNILFTVQSSINGYIIYCEDTEGDAKNCTLAIIDPPSPIENIGVIATQTILNITWIQPSHSFQCIDHYTVNINYTNNHTLLTTTDTSINVSLTGLYPTNYCVSVAGVDTANRTGEYSEEKCIELKVPAKPVVEYCTIDLSSSASFQFHISWKFNGTTQPLLTAVYLSHNVTGSITEEQLPSDEDEFTIATLKYEIYLITIFGKNALGNGSSSSLLVEPIMLSSSSCRKCCDTGGTIVITSIHPTSSVATNVDSEAVFSTTILVVTHVSTLLVTAASTAIVSSIVTLLVARKCCWKYNTSQKQDRQMNNQARLSTSQTVHNPEYFYAFPDEYL